MALLVAACIQPSGPQSLLRLRWPEPPDRTRIEHVQTIVSPRDLGPAPTSWERVVDFLLGSRPRYRSIAHPADVAVSSDGEVLYVSDFAQGIVHVLDLARGGARYFGERNRFARPFGLALDSEGRLYVVEQGARQIRVVDEAGATLKIIRSDRLIRPTDIEIDDARNRLYVADPSHQRSREHFIRVFDLDGNYLGEVGEGRGTRPGQLLFPTYVTLDPEGNLYVSDTMNSRISVFDPEGRFLRMLGSRGDGFGQFDKPKGIAFDSLGNLYVVDSSWSNVQIFGPQDDVLLFFGGRGGFPGLLRNPTGIAIAQHSNTIYVGDYLNRRVSVFQLVNTEADDGLLEQSQNGGTPR